MNQEVAEFRKPRLPYHPEIETRYGVDKSGWKALVEAVYPSAKTVDSVVMALSYCRARSLDPFKRPVHIVPMWDSNKGTYVETVWPGISELRTTAFRTKQYAGCDDAGFGDETTKNFSGTVGKRGHEEDVDIDVTFPAWCRVTVYRDLHGRVCKFVGPKVYWLETYATRGKSEIPNEMWAKRPRGQLEKCAEAAALRKAFPEELGNEYTAEEMEGQRIFHDERTIEITPTPPPAPPPAITQQSGNGTAQQQPRQHAPGSLRDGVKRSKAELARDAVAPRDPEQRAAFDMQAPPAETPHNPDTGEVIEGEATDGEALDPQPWLDELDTLMAGVRSRSELNEVWESYAVPNKAAVSSEHWREAEKAYERHDTRLGL